MIIYKAVNKINGKVYIGKTERCLKVRILEHGKYNCNRFGNAIRKYGIENFKFEEIEACGNECELNLREEHWIRFYDSKSPNGYNLTSGGEGSKNPPIEVLEKIRAAKLGKRNHMYGKTVSKETRDKLKEARKKQVITDERRKQMQESALRQWSDDKVRSLMISGMKGRKFSDEHIQKLRESHVGKKQSKESRIKRSESMKRTCALRKAAL